MRFYFSSLTFFSGNDNEILKGDRVSIDVCELGYDILMRNPARESCFHPSCNQDVKVWSSHLPYSQDEFYSLPCIEGLPTAPDLHFPRKHKPLLYTPQIKSYFVQPPMTPKHPSVRQQLISPTSALRDLIDWTIENEMYL